LFIYVWKSQTYEQTNSNSNISSRKNINFVKLGLTCACPKIRGEIQMWDRACSACRRLSALFTQKSGISFSCWRFSTRRTDRSTSIISGWKDTKCTSGL